MRRLRHRVSSGSGPLYAGLLAAAWTVVTAAAADWPLPDPRRDDVPGGVAGAPASDPRTYPDAAGFAERRDVVVRGLAPEDLGKWRRGYFAGGDPGKYLPGAAMAKLLLNPADEEARRFMNDDRSFNEHYHFAAVNWARYLPIFGPGTLTTNTLERFAHAAFRYGSYLNPAGTENHKTMWWTSANVLPHFVAGGRGLSSQGRDTTLAKAKGMLRQYVQGLYAAGQGEWDSSTYLMFDVNGLLNIYDFSPDAECRLLARAALDWLVAAYALKYRDGIYCAPNQRGHAAAPYGSIADQTGYLWWAGHRRLVPEDARDFRYALHAATSSWRPPRVLCNLALKQVPGLPAEQRNSKPNYWHGNSLPPRAGATHEVLHIGKHVSMGSLLDGHGGQITRFQVVADSPDGGIALTAGHPRKSDHTGAKTGVGYRDGIGRYDQIAQCGSTAAILTRVPDDEPVDYTFFAAPTNLAVTADGATCVIRTGSAWVGVTAIGGTAALGWTDLSDKEKQENEKRAAAGGEPRYRPERILRNTGRRLAFIVRVADADAFADEAAFRAALAAASTDAAGFADRMELACTGLDGRAMRVQFNPDPDGDSHGSRAAQIWDGGAKLDLAAWPVYSGPFVREDGGVLTVSDGRDGYTVDMTGDLPVYAAASRLGSASAANAAAPRTPPPAAATAPIMAALSPQ